MRLSILMMIVISFVATTVLIAQSNIDNTVPNKFAWGENVAWTNWRGEATPGQGALVGPFVMSGFVWGENIGWINLGDGAPATPPFYANVNGADFGVNIASDGTLTGYAWGENVGWINFDGGATATPPLPARIVCGDVESSVSARLSGYVWGENIGWINLDDATPTKFVALELAATPITCDVDQDGLKNGGDIQSFVDLLLSGSGSWRDVCSGDQPPLNGVIDLSDVVPFINCLLTAP
jgi:hypothetical protein